MAGVGSKIRAYKRQQAAQQKIEQKVTAQQERIGKPLVSSRGLSAPEPSEPMGMRPKESTGIAHAGYEKSVTGGRHHGTMLNIADAVGHSLASAETDKKYATSTVEDAGRALDRAYTHLGMHHSSHLMGNHAAAAGHLERAADALHFTMAKIGSYTASGVTNAFGEKHSRANLQKTIDATVSHYKEHHQVGASASVPAKPAPYTVGKTDADWQPPKTEEEAAVRDERKYAAPSKMRSTPRSKQGRLTAEEGLPKMRVGTVDLTADRDSAGVPRSILEKHQQSGTSQRIYERAAEARASWESKQGGK